jgi:hypothetical protein
LTVKELRKRLEQHPDHLAVAVQLEGEVSCRDRAGDPVVVTGDGYFGVVSTEKGTEFYAGKGFCPIVLLKAKEYT